jgi:hypothetical protein
MTIVATAGDGTSECVKRDNVGTVWTTTTIAGQPQRNSWISGWTSLVPVAYRWSCPKGPRTSSEPVGTCIDWSI